MSNLPLLADLIRKRNALEQEITAIIGRPASIGHLGEYIAAEVFKITLSESSVNKGSDGVFAEGPLVGKSVNVKWYGLREGLLDITPTFLPDYYLVLTGMKAAAVSSRGRSRPWLIDAAYLFDAHSLVAQLAIRGVKLGIASSVRNHFWDAAEIYPESRSTLLQLTDEQRSQLALFSTNVSTESAF